MVGTIFFEMLFWVAFLLKWTLAELLQKNISCIASLCCLSFIMPSSLIVDVFLDLVWFKRALLFGYLLVAVLHGSES